jgi:hypothetical protein
MMASTELTMNHHSTNTADTSASAIGREDTAAVFCHEQFADLDAEQFPRLPSTTYTPRPSKSFEATIEGLGWDSSAFKPTIFIRLAWAILQAKYTHNQDVLFGAATGINGTAYPNRVRLDYSETVEQALQALQAQSENLAAAVSTTDSKDLSWSEFPRLHTRNQQ